MNWQAMTTGQSDNPQSGILDAPVVEHTIDVFLVATSFFMGAGIGLVLAVLILSFTRALSQKSSIILALVKRIRTPFYIALTVWGAWIGLNVALLNEGLAAWSRGPLVSFLIHLLLILAIFTVTWIVYKAAWIFEDASHLRNSADKGRSRRFETQAQILRRVTQFMAVLLGIAAALFTFETARIAMTTIFASAGVISVIAGLAAQRSLGNIFAGLQLAFTDAIRVGDVVVVGSEKESGAIEEITLSYVVIRAWDDRRVIVPTTFFATSTFQNWTRRAAKQLGTVEITMGWDAPMDAIRAKVEEILGETDLWDGRSWSVQVTESTEETMTIRVAVSATDSGKLWDLRCHLREELLVWLVNRDDSEDNVALEIPENTDLDATVLMSLTDTMVKKGARLYSGSPDAEQRSEIWNGPGEDALAEREETARRRDTRNNEN